MVSPYLTAVALGWIIAQGLKYVFAGIKNRKWNQFRQLYLSGNMPSAHSATVSALTTVVGLRDGIDSALFAVSALLAAIVMYDAVMVRRSSGEQGIAIQAIIRELKSKTLLPRSAKGHTPLEVCAGAIIGILIGIGVYTLF